jgi:hypothetical protein
MLFVLKNDITQPLDDTDHFDCWHHEKVAKSVHCREPIPVENSHPLGGYFLVGLSGGDQRFLPSSLQAVWPARAATSSQTNCPNTQDALIVQFAQSTIALTCRIRSSVGQERGQAWREHEISEAPSFSTGISSCSRSREYHLGIKQLVGLLELRSPCFRVLLVKRTYNASLSITVVITAIVCPG